MSNRTRRPPRKSGPKPPGGSWGNENTGLHRLAGNPPAPDTAFRIRLRGRDGAPLSMPELRQGLLEAARELKAYDSYRAKWVTVYLTLIDDDGREVVPAAGSEITLHPYKSAAEEFGI